ncbi:hypothetical protein B0H19DRAFT_73894 [Mycena capillaripes]|nr:hypothetical protein B0H19DRAFT_73894 [Mycena capillaripes]
MEVLAVCAVEQPGSSSVGERHRQSPPARVRLGEACQHRRGEPTLPTVDDLEDEHTQYVLTDNDIIPDAATQRKLRAYAAQWRGVSALEPAPPPHHGAYALRLRPAARPPYAAAFLRAVVVLGFAVRLRCPTSNLYAPRRRTCTSARPPRTLPKHHQADGLRAPTNEYAHAEAPKPFVHLMGPPLNVALDARAAGRKGRWARTGCWPNAEVRAFVCGGGGGDEGRRRVREEGPREVDGQSELHTPLEVFALVAP